MKIQITACWIAMIVYAALIMSTIIFDVFLSIGDQGNRESTATTLVLCFIAAQLAVMNVFLGDIAAKYLGEKKDE